MHDTKMLNINVAVMGHVDTGKTSLVKALFKEKGGVFSTAAFDKHPESKRRGITIDLGFSNLEVDLSKNNCLTQNNDSNLEKKDSTPKKICFCLVDCPGHASLLGRVIGAAQIIDCVILVIDLTKGFQQQTLECLIVAEIVTERLIIVLNKIDLIPVAQREGRINLFKNRFQELLLKKTSYRDIPRIVSTSVRENGEIEGLDDLIEALTQVVQMNVPQRVISGPFLFLYDHAFHLKGFGTIVTGTVVSGKISLRQEVCVAGSPDCLFRIRSIQAFKKNVPLLCQGDRGGLCLTGNSTFTSSEHGLIVEASQTEKVSAATEIVAMIRCVKQYQQKLISKSFYNLMVGHCITPGKIIFFTCSETVWDKICQNDHKNSAYYGKTSLSLGPLSRGLEKQINTESLENHRFMFLESVSDEFKETHSTNKPLLALIHINPPHRLTCVAESLILGIDWDTDITMSKCRIAWFGKIVYVKKQTGGQNANDNSLLFIEKQKQKRGFVYQVNDADESIIGANMFQSRKHVDAFLNHKIYIENTDIYGFIATPFGTHGKFVVNRFNQFKPNLKGARILLTYSLNILDQTKKKYSS